MRLRDHLAVWLVRNPAAWKRAWGLWRCSKGKHPPLVWKKNDKRNPPRIPAGGPIEMMAAGGLFSLMAWIGWCPRCDGMVEWAGFDPRKEGYVKPGMSVAVRYTGVVVVLFGAIALAAVLL